MAYKIPKRKEKKKEIYWEEHQEINKENYKIFLENNGLTSKEYPYWQYEMDMKKERAKSPKTFNARF